MKLYELTSQYQELVDMDTTTAEDMDAYNVLMNELTGDITAKADNVAAVIKTLDAEADALAEEVKRLQDRKRALSNKSDGLRMYLHHNLKESGLDKVQGHLFTVALQKNPASVQVEESILADEWFVVTKSPDKTKIKDALKAGQVIEGATLWQSESLRIR
jgi:predicted nuclease with TOPRIM domain